jgi:hypothetical protein
MAQSEIIYEREALVVAFASSERRTYIYKYRKMRHSNASSSVINNHASAQNKSQCITCMAFGTSMAI